jgi:hypothetical protein
VPCPSYHWNGAIIPWFRSELNRLPYVVERARGEGRTGTTVASYDSDYWRKRADETRAAAEAMSTTAAKREMLAIAVAYERLADHAERTAGRKSKRAGT